MTARALVGLVADGDRLHRPGQVDRVDVLHPQVGTEAQRLLAHLVHQLGSGDAVAEAGVVLDLGGRHQRTAELGALEHQRVELGAGGVHGRGVAGGAGTDDDHVMDGGWGGHASLSACGNSANTAFGKQQGMPQCSR